MIDTHTHIYEPQFASDRKEVVQRALQAGVHTILLPNEDEKSLEDVAQTCQEYSSCRALYGLHPTEVRDNVDEQLQQIFSFAERQTGVVGVGEIGLDLYWDKSKLDLQMQAFRWQIKYSIDHQLPMSIHIRNAFEPMLEVFEEFRGEEIVGSLHCFSGDEAMAKHILSHYPNLLFGFNGTCTYKNSQLGSVIKCLPLTKILLETDAPYLAPVPNRGKRNEPSFLPLVAQHIAQYLNIPISEIEQQTDANAKQLFALD